MAEHIIGFIGLAGAGKDTAASAMLAEFRRQGQEATISGLADPIRHISRWMGLDPYDRTYKEVRHRFHVDWFCDAFQAGIDQVLRFKLTEHERAELYAFTIEALEPFISETQWGTVIDISPREFMQVLGTDAGQRVRQSLWAEIAAAQWEDTPGTVLVPDVRFEHELTVLDKAVLVLRPGLKTIPDHPSERLARQLDRGDWRNMPQSVQPVLFLRNDGGRGLLEWKAQCLAQRLIQEGSSVD